MLEVRGRKATNIQSSLFSILMDAREILNCVEQYLFIISEEGWSEIDNTEMFKKYPKLLIATITSLKYEIIIGVAKLTDTNLDTICLEKLFNQCEQCKMVNFKNLINKYRNEIKKYDYLLKKYIKTARDKIYAHIDYSFNANKIDKYGDYLLDSSILTSIKKFLELVINLCIDFSKLYDNDKMMLGKE